MDYQELLNAVLEVLYQIEIELKTNVNELKGSEEFEPEDIKRIFYDTKLKVKKNTEREDGQMSFVMDANRTWYAYNANYGTSEEKAFVEMFDRQVEELKKTYTDIYLIRNEKQFKIYNFEDGRAFQPDFVLFMKEKKTGEPLTYQLFIEPKGKHLADGDRWKEELLLEIRERYKDRVLTLGENKRYRILGVPFYNNEDENEFKKYFHEAVSSS